jgi:hypothetical protein
VRIALRGIERALLTRMGAAVEELAKKATAAAAKGDDDEARSTSWATRRSPHDDPLHALGLGRDGRRDRGRDHAGRNHDAERLGEKT